MSWQLVLKADFHVYLSLWYGFYRGVAQSDTQFWYRSDIGQNFRRENKGD